MQTELAKDQVEEAQWTTGCCPRFDSSQWDDKEVVWNDKPFVREHVRSLFHIPVGMGRHVTRAIGRINAAHAQAPRPLMLGEETSPWRSELYIESTKDVAGAEMAHLSGTYLAKVFEGPFRDAPKWEREMKRLVASRGKRMSRLFFGYTTCPRCAKAYGKNYVVMLAQLDTPASS